MNCPGKIIRKVSFGILLAAALCYGPVAVAAAQSGEAAAPAAAAAQAAPHTITLTKVVEVYEFEGLKVSVDQYQVARGDSLVKLLKSRGLLTSNSREEQARLIRLVRSLNPEVKDLSQLTIGQSLKLPAPLPPEPTGEAAEAPVAPATPATVTETVKVYERPQGSQQAAKVVVMRHVPGEGPAPAADPAPPVPATPAGPGTAAVTPGAAPAEPAPAPPIPAVPMPAPTETATAMTTPAAGTAPAVQPLDFPSGNAGPLAVEPSSQVVYRTVRVRRGDTLERLLRREGLHRDLIYSQLLKVTLELNPEIKNQDLIYAGAELRIPAAGDYLKAMAGVDPQEVRSAAAAISERRRPVGGGAGAGARARSGESPRAAVLELPDEAAVNAKNTLGLIFTRLGERLIAGGVRSIPSGAEIFELDTAVFPVVELGGGRQVVLDPGSRLNRAAVNSLRAQNYQVFRSSRTESLDRVLDRLWDMCGYYRVYKRDRTYEGGADIRLKIASDWIVWTTQEAWQAGQPLVINRARSAEAHTNPAWARFLEDHGLKVVDIYRNTLTQAAAAPAAAELKPVNLDSRNSAILASELLKSFGVEAKVGVQLDLGRDQNAAAASGLTAPLLWERGTEKVVLDFGEMPRDAAQTLRRNGYRLVTVKADNEAAIDGVLEGLGLKAKPELLLTAPSGGPTMSLTVKGRLVTFENRSYFITSLTLPAGLAALLDPAMTILKY
ncbi:MAG: LysM peptidoglycan-binding domain-containing protein [Candidatus Adiutrix sp.]|jgi:hypothetical protein|nr:LysM peptidoglycan-binding domain-containing protein [Candidatus Adiutrix sp.]